MHHFSMRTRKTVNPVIKTYTINYYQRATVTLVPYCRFTFWVGRRAAAPSGKSGLGGGEGAGEEEKQKKV